MKHLANLDLSKFQLQNAVMHTLSAAPASPTEAQHYYLSSTKIPMYWNGTAWRPMDASALTDGSIPNSALTTNPLARVNHTGQQPASSISDLATVVKAYRHDEFAVPTAPVSYNNQRITALADPIAAQDAVPRDWAIALMQSAASGIDSKPSVRVVAIANLTLSGLQTIDGITVAAGDRVLATAQTTGSQNGVYTAASGAWTRAVDADATGEITPGAFWFIEEGTTYGSSQWRCSNTGTITLGTTAVTIAQFGAATTYAPGNGLQLTGNTFSVKLDTSSGLVSSGTGLKIDTATVTRKYAATITGNGSLTAFAITHSLGTKNVVVAIRDSGDTVVLVDWTATDTNTVTVNFGLAPANAVTYYVAVVG